jgi:hypothetical protein
MGDTTIRRWRWKPYRSAAIFLYLLLIQNFDLKPPPLLSTDFVDRLLQQTKNIDTLRKFFHAYQVVQTALSPYQYSFPSLEFDLGEPAPDLQAAEFSPEMTRTLSDWIQHG